MSAVSERITARVGRLSVSGVTLIPHGVGVRSSPTRGTSARLMPMLIVVLSILSISFVRSIGKKTALFWLGHLQLQGADSDSILHDHNYSFLDGGSLS